MSTLANAIAIAAEAHLTQTDRANKPYILHCLTVMEGVKHKVDEFYDTQLLVVAVLHDLLEDTNWTASALLKAGFSKATVSYIETLTRTKDISYDEYINIISTCHICSTVKAADLRHNMDILRLDKVTEKDLARQVKYHKAYQTLTRHWSL